MTTARKADPIRRMTTKCGETRCRFVIDVGKQPNGKRDQRCYTYTKWEEARAARVKIIADPWSGRGVRLRRLSHLACRLRVEGSRSPKRLGGTLLEREHFQ